MAKPSLSLVSLLASLIALESCFRILGIQGHYDQPHRHEEILRSASEKRAPFGYVPFAVVRTHYAFDPRGYFDPGHIIDHRHNSGGWRDVEHKIEKPAGSFRILGLGDSYLWGQGVRRRDICLTKLPNLIADCLPGQTIQTINTGLWATNTAFQRRLLENRGLSYDPDLVILHFVLNDVEPDVTRHGPKIDFFVDYTWIYLSPDRFSAYSHLWGWARQQYLRYVRARKYIGQCLESFDFKGPKWAQCSESLDGIARLCHRQRIPLLVVIFPFFHELDGDYPFQPLHDLVRLHCLANRIHVLDLREHYRQFRGPELWVHPTDQHPNEIAHDIAAHAIAGYLRKHPELLEEARSDP